MIFPEMMAEMRRPMDFYKGMACAQMLIFVVYLMYGIFCKDFVTIYASEGDSLVLASQSTSSKANTRSRIPSKGLFTSPSRGLAAD
jgi:hypothetical protein